MKKLFIAFLLTVSFSATAQVFQVMPQPGYETERMKIKTRFLIPTRCDTPAVLTAMDTSSRMALLMFDTCGRKLWYYNPKVKLWDTIRAGATFDSAFIYALANSKLAIADTANMRLRANAGSNITITGTYPNLTFSAAGGTSTDTANLSNRIDTTTKYFVFDGNFTTSRDVDTFYIGLRNSLQFVDQIISVGSIELNDSTVSIMPDIIYSRAGIVDTISVSSDFVIPATGDDLFRTDLIYLNISNEIDTVMGVPDSSRKFPPPLPGGGIFISIVDVQGSDINIYPEQTGTRQWTQGGNDSVVNGTMGSINNVPVGFITNNSLRAYLGNLGGFNLAPMAAGSNQLSNALLYNSVNSSGVAKQSSVRNDADGNLLTTAARSFIDYPVSGERVFVNSQEFWFQNPPKFKTTSLTGGYTFVNEYEQSSGHLFRIGKHGISGLPKYGFWMDYNNQSAFKDSATAADIESSAIVNISSTTKGLKIPTMTGVQMNAIASPANGLMVYNTDSLAHCYYNGSAWVKMGGGGGGSQDLQSVTNINYKTTNGLWAKYGVFGDTTQSFNISNGNLSVGDAVSGGLIDNDEGIGNIVSGRATGSGSEIYANDVGGMSMGVTQSGGKIISSGSPGAVAIGAATSGGLIQADDAGSLAIGFSNGDSLFTTGAGSMAIGNNNVNEAKNSYLFGSGLRNYGFTDNERAFKVGWDGNEVVAIKPNDGSSGLPFTVTGDGTSTAAFMNGNVGIGTTTPDSTLHVIGGVILDMPSKGAGKVLTSDANGAATWETPTGGSGVTTMTTISAIGATNGATISGSTLQLNKVTATTGGVLTIGTDTIAGNKNWTGAGNYSGTDVVITGGNSVDYPVRINRNITGTVSKHGFGDLGTISLTSAAAAYSSFQARFDVANNTNLDHISMFQSTPTIGNTDTIGDSYGLYHVPIIGTNSQLKNNYGLYHGVSGAGIKNNIGLYYASTSTATNTDSLLSVLADVGRAEFKGAPEAKTKYGSFSIGNGGFDGTTSGFFNGFASGTMLALNGTAAYTGNLFDFQAGGTTRMLLSNSGLVGIGATNSQMAARLNVHTPASSTSSHIRVSNNSTGTNSSSGLWLGITSGNLSELMNKNATSLTLGTNNTARLVISSGGDVSVSTGSLSLATAGSKLSITTGTNASIGVSAAMTAGTITISTTAVTANSKIFLTHASVAGTQGILSPGTIVPGTSFVINSSSATDTGTVNWWIIN